jgi:hypothetical protein
MPSDTKSTHEENIQEPKYNIDIKATAMSGRSLSIMIGGRRCYMCQQGDESPVASANPEDLILQISQHCKDTHDYLLPNTPLKEAIFRAILARGNQPTTALEISMALTTKWAMSANSRDISSKIIQELMDQSRSYMITPAAEPKSEGENTTVGIQPQAVPYKDQRRHKSSVGRKRELHI